MSGPIKRRRTSLRRKVDKLSTKLVTPQLRAAVTEPLYCIGFMCSGHEMIRTVKSVRWGGIFPYCHHCCAMWKSMDKTSRGVNYRNMKRYMRVRNIPMRTDDIQCESCYRIMDVRKFDVCRLNLTGYSTKCKTCRAGCPDLEVVCVSCNAGVPHAPSGLGWCRECLFKECVKLRDEFLRFPKESPSVVTESMLFERWRVFGFRCAFTGQPFDMTVCALRPFVYRFNAYVPDKPGRRISVIIRRGLVPYLVNESNTDVCAAVESNIVRLLDEPDGDVVMSSVWRRTRCMWPDELMMDVPSELIDIAIERSGLASRSEWGLSRCCFERFSSKSLGFVGLPRQSCDPKTI